MIQRYVVVLSMFYYKYHVIWTTNKSLWPIHRTSQSPRLCQWSWTRAQSFISFSKSNTMGNNTPCLTYKWRLVSFPLLRSSVINQFPLQENKNRLVPSMTFIKIQDTSFQRFILKRIWTLTNKITYPTGGKKHENTSSTFRVIDKVLLEKQKKDPSQLSNLCFCRVIYHIRD